MVAIGVRYVMVIVEYDNSKVRATYSRIRNRSSI